MRFRFTIRDLLWLTAVVALCLGWWLEHRHFVSLRADFDEERSKFYDRVNLDAKALQKYFDMQEQRKRNQKQLELSEESAAKK